MNLRKSLNLSFVALFLVSVITAVVVYRERQERIVKHASDHLTTMLTLRASVLSSYLESLRSEVILWSSRPVVINVMTTANAEFERRADPRLDTLGTATVESLTSAAVGDTSDTLDSRIRRFTEHHHYYDVFFISVSGDVVYSAAKEDDFGTNLIEGPYADSGLGRLFRTLRQGANPDDVAFEDFSQYAPSANEAAAFIGSPVYTRTDTGEDLIGFYAVQVPAAPINSIMQFSAGMGESGEIYLVGHDRLMRSDSRFFDESAILSTTVSGVTVDKALAGEMGLEVVDDYRGIPVFSAYRPFDFEGTRWAVLAEQDSAEVYAPIAETLKWIFIGYAGLILIGALLRVMLMHAVLPAALGAFFGLSALESLDDT